MKFLGLVLAVIGGTVAVGAILGGLYLAAVALGASSAVATLVMVAALFGTAGLAGVIDR